MNLKNLGYLILSASLLNVFPSEAAMPKPGTNCSRVGLTQIYGDKKFVCTKIGKSLHWKLTYISPIKISSKPSPAATPTALPSFQPTPTVSPSVSASAVPSAKPTTENISDPVQIDSITQLATNFKDIKYWAWQNTWIEIKSQPDNKTPIQIHVGPNSKSCHVDTTIEAIRLLQKVYGDAKLPNKVHLIYADMNKDFAWLENITSSLLPRNRIQFDNNGRMTAIETVNQQGEGVVWATDSCYFASAENFSSQVLHAYTHTIQDLQYSDYPNGYGRWGEVPRWLIEGGASWSQVFYNDNQNLKKYLRDGDWYVLSSYDSKFFQEYLQIPEYSNNLWAYTDKWPGMRAYDLGVFVVEMLIALKGPYSIIQLNSEYLKTGNFELSFKNIFGMTWKEAQPIISEAAFKEIKWLSS